MKRSSPPSMKTSADSGSRPSWLPVWILLGIGFIGGTTFFLLEDRDAVPNVQQTPTTIERGPATESFVQPRALPRKTDNFGTMVRLPAGAFLMGSAPPVTEEDLRLRIAMDETPPHLVVLKAFWIDEAEVTNDQFEQFVKATNYVTDAEKPPQEKPDAPAGSVVFSPPPQVESLDNHLVWWRFVPGANWRQPEGPGSSIHDRRNHPVVHVSWNDAKAYADWAKKRLPTEAEWEYASRGGLHGERYVWGKEFLYHGKHLANTWQGGFPLSNSEADGFARTAPVRSYPPNGYGLYDMAGNVWEWCADWYRPDTYEKRANGWFVFNPKGPLDSYDPQEPGIMKRVQRGGSFLCNDGYCSRYRPAGRGKGDIFTGTSHIGFRCARDAE